MLSSTLFNIVEPFIERDFFYLDNKTGGWKIFLSHSFFNIKKYFYDTN